MDKTSALKVWEHEYGQAEYARDITGKKIKRDDYNIENQVGWVISYMFPLSLGGKEEVDNMIILHHRTAEEKGDDYPVFSVDSMQFQIVHDEDGDFYYVEALGARDDDM